MDKIKVTIVGYGNIGHGVHNALKHSPDMELVQIITRDPDRVRKEVKGVKVSPIRDFSKEADVAILCSGSRSDLFNKETDTERLNTVSALDSPLTMGQGPYFAQFFNTVDSFDTHARIPDYFTCMDRFARDGKHTSLLSAGWDPGTFSMERLLGHSFFPQGCHYTFWGPGVSQGHSDAVRGIKGVKDARQYTIPVKDAIDRVRAGECPEFAPREKHQRLVYVVLEQDADTVSIEQEIRSMPYYFAEYETKIEFVTDKELLVKHSAYPHGGFVLTSGYTGDGNRAMLEYRCEWGDNAGATACILVACARACHRLHAEHAFGAFSMFDIPPAYYHPASREELVRTYL